MIARIFRTENNEISDRMFPILNWFHAYKKAAARKSKELAVKCLCRDLTQEEVDEIIKSIPGRDGKYWTFWCRYPDGDQDEVIGFLKECKKFLDRM